MKARARPNIALAPDADGYATLLVQGVDSLQESFWLDFQDRFMGELEKAKQDAGGPGDRNVTPIEVGAERVYVWAHGARGGVNWVWGHDDFLVLLRQPGTRWNVTVRYLSAGLWEHGAEALRARVLAMFDAVAGVAEETNGDFERLTRIDYAFDFYAPAFTAEMADPAMITRFIAHARTKVHANHAFDLEQWGRPDRAETYTLGRKDGLQVQVYDKSREITQVSGKGWMIDLWERSGLWSRTPDMPIADIWRLECRFGKAGYLRDRNLQKWPKVKAMLPTMISEALFSRRLTVPTADSNRRRWPLHPLWTLAYEAAAVDDYPPFGRRVTGRRDALVDDGEKQLAGTLRSHLVLEDGAFDYDRARAKALDIVEIAAADPDHGVKERKAIDRYELVEEAR